MTSESSEYHIRPGTIGTQCIVWRVIFLFGCFINQRASERRKTSARGLVRRHFASIRLPETKTPRQNDPSDSETPNVTHSTTIVSDALVSKLISERKSLEMFRRKEKVTY